MSLKVKRMSNTPEIRFEGFEGSWEQKKLGEILTERNVQHPQSEEYPLVSFTVEDGVTPKTERYEREQLVRGDKSAKKYKETRLDDIVYNPANLKFGAISRNKYGNAVFSPIYVTFDVERKLAEPSFVEKMVTKNDFIQQALLYQQGTVYERMSVNSEDLCSLYITLPFLDEQRKIGKYLDELNSAITLNQRKAEQYKTLKKYMLQKMFPKNGEKVPEIRFEGFTDAWEQRKFGDLADYKKGPFGSAITKDMFVPKSADSVKVYEQQNAINKDWKLERYFLPRDYASTKLKSFEVHGGDIIVSCAGTIGEIYEIPEDAESGVINQALMRVRVDEETTDKGIFRIVFSNMIDEFTRVHSNGSAIKNIPPFADLKPMEVFIPSHDEQKKIAEYFSNLDHLITLHQLKSDEFKTLKKYMLQKMFPKQ